MVKEADPKEEYNKGQAIANSPYKKNIADLRYAYADTVHKMQSLEPLEAVFLNAEKAHDTDNPASESYFRWLYTASLCAKEYLFLLNYPRLMPFSKTNFVFDDCKIQSINIRHKIYQNSSYPAGSDEYLAKLEETVSTLLSVSGWEIKAVQHFSYKERYCISTAEGLAGELELNYNGKGDAYIGKIDVSERDKILNVLLQKIPFKAQAEEVQFAVELLTDTLKKAEWRGDIISYEEKPYKLFLILCGVGGNLKIELNVPSRASASKKGIISSLKLLEAETREAADIFKTVFADYVEEVADR